jgi:serine/threonine protein kinase
VRFLNQSRSVSKERLVFWPSCHTQTIPAVYDVDFSPGKFSIHFQFIDGHNLKKIIDQNGPSQIGTVRVWFHQIALALEHAHKLGVVHRDIKPENIIVTPDSASAYLVDFGIALTAEEQRRLTQTGYVIGTPGYMSPEQMAGDLLDARTDIYSLAVTFFEVLAGKRMPVGGYEYLSANEAIPETIDGLILDCLNPRERRLSSARLFSARLTGALAQPRRQLSDVLAHGKLHELGTVIEDMSSSEFMALPRGQRVLILTKIVDVVGSNEHNLMYAAERFLQLMVTRGVLMEKEDYREIASPAVRWAFEKHFEASVGRESIRKSLEEAAFLARDGAYEVLTEEILEYMKDVELQSKEDWYLHTMRDVVEALMANPECEAGASELGAILRNINRVQRAKPWRSGSRY